MNTQKATVRMTLDGTPVGAGVEVVLRSEFPIAVNAEPFQFEGLPEGAYDGFVCKAVDWEYAEPFEKPMVLPSGGVIRFPTGSLAVLTANGEALEPAKEGAPPPTSEHTRNCLALNPN